MILLCSDIVSCGGINNKVSKGGKVEIDGEFFTYDSQDCWVVKSLANKTHWRDLLHTIPTVK